MREISTVKYDSEMYTDTNMLLNFQMMDPVMLDVNLTYLWGKDSTAFPLLNLTAGNNAISTKKVVNGGDTQYQWPVQTRMRHTSRIRRLVSGANTDGTYGNTITVEMADNWFIHQHTAIAPSGFQYRIQAEGRPTSTGTYIYRFSSLSGNALAQPLASDFRNGVAWGLGASSIPASKSNGNRSNNQAPSMATNQYGYYRFSKHIAGAVGDKVVNIALDTDGGTTNYWMPYEMKQWEILRRIQLEEDLWYSEYNRDANGQVMSIDEETGEHVPRGAGVREILKSVGNLESYSRLTVNRLDRIINRIFENRLDNPVEEIVLYCGKGFWKDFNDALYLDARLKNYFSALGDNEIRSGGQYLSYGTYFNQYKTLYGKTITVQLTDIFDNGIRADMDRQNGNMINGLPASSYNAVFMDHTLGMDGERNVQFIVEENREYKVGIYKGMANLPGSWAVMDDRAISDRRDIATYEVLGSQGINFKNPMTSFWLERGSNAA